MKNRTKKILTRVCFVLAIVAAGMILCLAFLNSKPRLFAHLVERPLSAALGTKVSIQEATIHISGARMNLTGVDMDLGQGSYLRAPEISVRLLSLSFSDKRISPLAIEITRPEARLDLKYLKDRAPGHGGILPKIRIHQGILTLVHKDRKVSFDRINASFASKHIDLSTEILGSKAVIHALQKDRGWKGTAESRGINLGTFKEKGLEGRCSIKCAFDTGKKTPYLSLNMDIRGLTLPWKKDPFDDIAIHIRTKGNPKETLIENISIQSGPIDITGTGRIQGKISKDALMDLNMHSNTFDYETVVKMLPEYLFPDMFSDLIFRHIREGKSCFEEISYRGRISTLADKRGLLDGLTIREIIDGQSLGYGFGSQRVRNITGTVTLSKGDIIFKDLCGYMNEAQMKHVDIRLKDIGRPGTRGSVDVDLDMPGHEFINAWRALMPTKGIHDILDPVSDVQGGRISGQVSTIWNDQGMQTKGTITVKNAGFSWNKTPLRHISGTICSPAFDSPLQINLQGLIHGLQVKDLDLSIKDPFGEKISTLKMGIQGLPETRTFCMGKDTEVMLTGTGLGMVFQGNIQAAFKGFSIFGTQYTLIKGPAEADG
ncbi:MAG: hypothetical protein U9P80_00590, partial [Thermodesulfobacteriota bacterium]|nr:hypothetical protein [Thermodesulfobacteriota bacterium]